MHFNVREMNDNVCEIHFKENEMHQNTHKRSVHRTVSDLSESSMP